MNGGDQYEKTYQDSNYRFKTKERKGYDYSYNERYFSDDYNNLKSKDNQYSMFNSNGGDTQLKKFNNNYKKNNLYFLDDDRSKFGEHLIESYHKEDDISFREMIIICLKLGFISFGGPQAHQDLIFSKFCKENNFLTVKHYRHIINFCLVLPGYSSSTLISAICGIKRKSITEGFLALICFNIPSLFAVLIFALILKGIRSQIHSEIEGYNPDIAYFSNINQPFLFLLMLLSTGIIQAALGLMIQAGYSLAKKHSYSKFQFLLLLFAGVMYYLVPNYMLMVLLIIICGMMSSIKGDHDYLFDHTEIMGFEENLSQIKFIGLPCFSLFLILYFLLYTIQFFVPNLYIFLFESFFRIGSLSFGEGHVVIPMILSEYTEKKLLDETEVLNGYAIISLLPGSMFNMAAYSGVICKNILGGIIANIGIFLPGFLILYGALPFIDRIKASNFLQFFIRGANSAAIGFLFIAALKLWIDCCFINPYSNAIIGTINVLICFTMVESFKMHKPFVIIFGAFFSLAISYAKIQWQYENLD